MGDTRWTGGIAYGRYGNFFNGTNTAGLIAESDTTPDVTHGNLFYTNNTSNTTITDFEFTTPGPIPGGSAKGSVASQFEGKFIRVIFLDDSTRLANATPFVLASSDGLQGANNSIELLYHNSSWVELGRSYNQSNYVSVQSSGLGTTGIVSIRGRGPSVTISATGASGSASIIRRVTGGEQGQQLVIANAGSATHIVVNSAAADTFVSSGSDSGIATYILETSSAIHFTRIGNKWWESRNLVQGSINWVL